MNIEKHESLPKNKEISKWIQNILDQLFTYKVYKKIALALSPRTIKKKRNEQIYYQHDIKVGIRKVKEMRLAFKRLKEKIESQKNLKPSDIVQELAQIVTKYIPTEFDEDFAKSFPNYPINQSETLLTVIKKIRLSKYKARLDYIINRIDSRRRILKYMSQESQQQLIKLFSGKVEKGDNGYPLKVMINGEKWYITDISFNPKSQKARILKQARAGLAKAKTPKEKNSYLYVIRNIDKLINPKLSSESPIILIKANNPLIRSSIKFSQLKQNPFKILKLLALRAQKTWEKQQKQKESLRKFDLPKRERIACLSLYPGYMNPRGDNYKPDRAFSSGIIDTQMFSQLLNRKGYNIEPSNPTYTNNPEDVIRAKIALMKKAKPPIKHLVIHINAHGVGKKGGGGSVFNPENPKLPEEIPKKLIELFKLYNNKRFPNCKSYEDVIVKKFFKTKKHLLTPQQKQKIKLYLTKYRGYLTALRKSDIDSNKTQRLHGDEIVKICRENPDIKFMIINHSCHGGDFARYFKKAKLPNALLSVATQPHDKARNVIVRDDNNREIQSSASFGLFFNKGLAHLGGKLIVPKIKNGKMIKNAQGKQIMVYMKIKTIGDALHYADIMTAYSGALDDPEVVLPS